MRQDYLIAIILAIAAVPAGVAVMPAPLKFENLSRRMVNICFYGGIAVTIALFALAVAIAMFAEERSNQGLMPLLGMIVCGLGFVSFAAWYLWPTNPKIVKNETHAEFPVPQFNRPAFEISDNAKVSVDDTKIVNNPAGVAKVSGSGQLVIHGSLLSGPTSNIQFPPPSNRLINLTNEDLRILTLSISMRLRQFQEEINQNLTGTIRPKSLDEAKIYQETITKRFDFYSNKFKEDFLSSCSDVASEIIRRIGRIELPTVSDTSDLSEHKRQMRLQTGAEVLAYRTYAGYQPAISVADFLEFLLSGLQR